MIKNVGHPWGGEHPNNKAIRAALAGQLHELGYADPKPVQEWPRWERVISFLRATVSKFC